MSGANLLLVGVPEEVQQALRETEAEMGARTLNALTRAGFDTVAFLRSLLPGLTRPPVRAGEGERQAHPGGWADITGQLAGAYRFEVRDAIGQIIKGTFTRRQSRIVKATPPFELEFFNDTEYASYLENRDGFWVLSGIDGPGGPFQQILFGVIQDVKDMEGFG